VQVPQEATTVAAATAVGVETEEVGLVKRPALTLAHPLQGRQLMRVQPQLETWNYRREGDVKGFVRIADRFDLPRAQENR
jgi:hypothetical protein